MKLPKGSRKHIPPHAEPFSAKLNRNSQKGVERTSPSLIPYVFTTLMLGNSQKGVERFAPQPEWVKTVTEVVGGNSQKGVERSEQVWSLGLWRARMIQETPKRE